MDREQINSLRQGLIEKKESFEAQLKPVPAPPKLLKPGDLDFFQRFWFVGSEEVQNRRIWTQWQSEFNYAEDFNRCVYKEIDKVKADIQKLDEQVRAPYP